MVVRRRLYGKKKVEPEPVPVPVTSKPRVKGKVSGKSGKSGWSIA